MKLNVSGNKKFFRMEVDKLIGVKMESWSIIEDKTEGLELVEDEVQNDL